MRWLIYGSVNSRHAVDSLIASLRRGGDEVVEVRKVKSGLLFKADPEVEAESRRRIEAALPADVMLVLAPSEPTPRQLEEIRARGITTIAWLADDPLLFKVSYKHVAAAYDITLHCAREDVLRFYERRLGVRGFAFPWWTDDAHFPYAYDPDAADIEVGFMGNCHRRRRHERYDLLDSLPWETTFYGRLAKEASDHAGIHGGLLEQQQIPVALRRFRVGLSMAQTFVGVDDKFSFKALPRFGEYFFPSRLVLYAATGIPTVSLTRSSEAPPFPAVITAQDRDELLARIGELINDREALLAASRAVRRDFEDCLTADSRVAMLRELLKGNRDHTVDERAELWRHFGRVPARAGA